MSFEQQFQDTFVTLYSENLSYVNSYDNVLIYIKRIEEMSNKAGYFIYFMPISGDFNLHLKNIIITNNGFYAEMTYSMASRLMNRSTTPIELFLNGKLHD